MLYTLCGIIYAIHYAKPDMSRTFCTQLNTCRLRLKKHSCKSFHNLVRYELETGQRHSFGSQSSLQTVSRFDCFVQHQAILLGQTDSRSCLSQRCSCRRPVHTSEVQYSRVSPPAQVTLQILENILLPCQRFLPILDAKER